MCTLLGIGFSTPAAHRRSSNFVDYSDASREGRQQINIYFYYVVLGLEPPNLRYNWDVACHQFNHSDAVDTHHASHRQETPRVVRFRPPTPCSSRANTGDILWAAEAITFLFAVNRKDVRRGSHNLQNSIATKGWHSDKSLADAARTSDISRNFSPVHPLSRILHTRVSTSYVLKRHICGQKVYSFMTVSTADSSGSRTHLDWGKKRKKPPPYRETPDMARARKIEDSNGNSKNKKHNKNKMTGELAIYSIHLGNLEVCTRSLLYIKLTKIQKYEGVRKHATSLPSLIAPRQKKTAAPCRRRILKGTKKGKQKKVYPCDCFYLRRAHDGAQRCCC